MTNIVLISLVLATNPMPTRLGDGPPLAKVERITELGIMNGTNVVSIGKIHLLVGEVYMDTNKQWTPFCWYGEPPWWK